jgi:ubiquinone/menaquinone biosynthesis C-methylase UbiE
MTANGNAGKQQNLSDEVFDARYFKALDRFDISLAPTMWVYDNVRAGSQVLHVGCGAGTLALLKRKGVTITGVDTSGEFARAARRNGYDASFQADPGSLPFLGQSFDYVVSFGLLDALAASEEESLLAEMKRVLRSDGVSLHGIECSNAVTAKDHSTRFLKVFQHVAIEPRSDFCLSAEDFLDANGRESKLEPDFLEYLRGLSFKERRAFDLAMGYVYSRISDLGVSLPSGIPQVLLKAVRFSARTFLQRAPRIAGGYSLARGRTRLKMVCASTAAARPVLTMGGSSQRCCHRSPVGWEGRQEFASTRPV